MRIDLHVRSGEVSESSRSGGSNATSKKKASSSGAAQTQADEARLSFSPARVRELTQIAGKVPDTRKDRVQSLKVAIDEGRYNPPTEQVSNAMLSDALARTDLLRR